MHVEKYNRSAMGHMLAHYDRTHPGSKSQIDDTKTHLNYNLAAVEQPLPQLDFIHQRLICLSQNSSSVRSSSFITRAASTPT